MIVLILNVFMIVVVASAMEVLSQNTQREIGQRPKRPQTWSNGLKKNHETWRYLQDWPVGLVYKLKQACGCCVGPCMKFALKPPLGRPITPKIKHFDGATGDGTVASVASEGVLP